MGERLSGGNSEKPGQDTPDPVEPGGNLTEPLEGAHRIQACQACKACQASGWLGGMGGHQGNEKTESRASPSPLATALLHGNGRRIALRGQKRPLLAELPLQL